MRFFFALLLKNVSNISNAFFNETNLFQSSMENNLVKTAGNWHKYMCVMPRHTTPMQSCFSFSVSGFSNRQVVCGHPINTPLRSHIKYGQRSTSHSIKRNEHSYECRMKNQINVTHKMKITLIENQCAMRAQPFNQWQNGNNKSWEIDATLHNSLNGTVLATASC